jgi:hypothetical protein
VSVRFQVVPIDVGVGDEGVEDNAVCSRARREDVSSISDTKMLSSISDTTSACSSSCGKPFGTPISLANIGLLNTLSAHMSGSW